MTAPETRFSVGLANTAEQVRAAQHLRYQVFVQELGGDGVLVDHDQQLETDAFDPHCDHLILQDQLHGGQVIGTYRLMRTPAAQQAGQFYSEDEYDLTQLKQSNRELLELGRSCVHSDHRNGQAMFLLWQGLADYVALHQIEIMFGVASFHGTDIEALKEPLSLLHHRYLAPAHLRVRACGKNACQIDYMAENDIDRPRAVSMIPTLIKSYLRLGGFIGDGVFIDNAFNTTDVCLIMDTDLLNTQRLNYYARAAQ